MKNSTLNFNTLLLGTCLLLTFLTTNAQIQKGSDLDGETAYDYSGHSVSMPDANTVAIGAPYNDGNGSQSGHVRIYSWSGKTWLQKGDDIYGDYSLHNLGWSVSMPDANTIAIGAPYTQENGSHQGRVEIYSWSGTAWVQKGNDIVGEYYGDQSGVSVSMPDANTVAIGAYDNDGNGIWAGHVRIYSWSGTAWVQKGDDIDGEEAGDLSGISVSMPDANIVAIGAHGNSGNGFSAGHVRIYSWSGTAWVQKGDDIDGEEAGDRSGSSISMPDADTVAIGAYDNDGNGIDAGHVRIYSWSGTSWIQKGDDINGKGAGDNLGYQVSMPDPNTVAIGAMNEHNSTDTGYVQIFSWNGTAWIQKGVDINGEEAGDWAGFSISMPDADIVAIGAKRNGGNGDDAGNVRVYSVSGLGIEKEIVTNIKVYPNPSSTQVIIDNGNYSAMGSYNAEIVNAMGQQVFHSVINQKQFVIDTKTMGGAGIYTLYITDENNKVVGAKKIVLQ